MTETRALIQNDIRGSKGGVITMYQPVDQLFFGGSANPAVRITITTLEYLELEQKELIVKNLLVLV